VATILKKRRCLHRGFAGWAIRPRRRLGEDDVARCSVWKGGIIQQSAQGRLTRSPNGRGSSACDGRTDTLTRLDRRAPSDDKGGMGQAVHAGPFAFTGASRR